MGAQVCTGTAHDPIQHLEGYVFFLTSEDYRVRLQGTFKFKKKRREAKLKRVPNKVVHGSPGCWAGNNANPFIAGLLEDEYIPMIFSLHFSPFLTKLSTMEHYTFCYFLTQVVLVPWPETVDPARQGYGCLLSHGHWASRILLEKPCLLLLRTGRFWKGFA
jgi:hypothetical protein